MQSESFVWLEVRVIGEECFREVHRKKSPGYISKDENSVIFKAVGQFCSVRLF